jgi:hypothetical protein
MNFASYQQEKAGHTASVPTPPARTATLDVPRPAAPAAAGDGFAAGARALAAGRTDEGVRLLAAAYAARPSGPSSLGPAQQVAMSGAATALASVLLSPEGAGADAAASLQAHLHYASCFRESASVGALVYTDGRASRAQTAFDVACSLARSGDNDRAMEWIDRAIHDGFRSGALLDGEPDLATLRLRHDWPALRAQAD